MNDKFLGICGGRTSVVLLLAAFTIAGCQTVPLNSTATVTPVQNPLTGNIKVMLPYDLRPAIERGGEDFTTGMDFNFGIIDLDYETTTTVTSDSQFSLPTKDKSVVAQFKHDGVIPAAVCLDIIKSLQNSNLFQTVSEQPSSERPQLVKIKAAPPRNILAPALAHPGDSEQEAQNLHSQLESTRLPPVTSDWLLRVSILHLFASEISYGNSAGVNVPLKHGGEVGTEVSSVSGPGPYGNAVLACELYRNVNGKPRLVWERTIAAAKYGEGDCQEVVDALSDALTQMIRGLAADLPALCDNVLQGMQAQ